MGTQKKTKARTDFSQNYLMRVLLILFIFTTNVNASLSRLGFTTGAKQVSYKETHEFQSVLDKDFTQYSAAFDFDGHLYLLPYWLYVGFSTSYIGPVLSSSQDEQATYLRYSAYSGFTIPAKPFNLNIESEYYSDTMKPNSSSFGYNDMSGTRISAIADWLSKSGSTQIYVKYPFYNTVKNRTDIIARLKFYFTQTKAETPPSLTQGLYLSLDYSSVKVTIPGDLEIVIKNKEMGLSLGYNW